MAITLLQDHTDFIGRMLAMAMNHDLAMPLNIRVLEEIRRKSLVTKHRSKLVTMGQLQELANVAARGAESESIGRAQALAVEGDYDGWYCVQDDEGVQWLLENPVGPVLRWNGGVWWGRLKGIEIQTEVVTHDSFKPRKRDRSSPRQAEEDQSSRGYGNESSGLRRPDVRPLG